MGGVGPVRPGCELSQGNALAAAAIHRCRCQLDLKWPLLAHRLITARAAGAEADARAKMLCYLTENQLLSV